jgi:predicted dehydrogenase
VGQPLRIGLVGVGNISGAYLKTFQELETVKLVAIADIDRVRAAEAAAAQGVRELTVDELVADPEVDLVLNLTIPAAHAEIALKAIAAGKGVYGEKPFATTLGDASRVLEAGRIAGVRVGSAPDTVLGTGIQTGRRAVDDGLIGSPISATATMVTPGHERWHPNPDFYYQPGGGPLLDMGPYYITALVNILGPISSVVGMASGLRDSRTIATGPRAGYEVKVNVATHVTGMLRHESGVLSTLVMSFDGVETRSPNIEIHGETASLVLPDPNTFDGDVRIRTLDSSDWRTLPESAGYRNASRGIGLADLASTPADKPIRASGTVAFHVLDVMLSLLSATAEGSTVCVESTCERPTIVSQSDPQAQRR